MKLITLSYRPVYTIIGKLIYQSPYGEGVIKTPEGERKYVWPLLKVEDYELQKTL